MMSTTEKATTTDYAAMVDYLENLLARQRDRLSVYDIDGACAIASETESLTDELTRHQVLKKPEFAEQGRRLQQQYREICLIIADQRQEVSDKMLQIRKGIKALGGYAGK
jgi:hypothetical protein